MTVPFFNDDNDDLMPDYDYWIKQSAWNYIPGQYYFAEPVSLMMNLEPRLLRNVFMGKVERAEYDKAESDVELKVITIRGMNDFWDTGRSLDNEIYTGIALGTLKHGVIDPSPMIKNMKYMACSPLGWKIVKEAPKRYVIEPSEFIQWAKTRGLRIPDPFLVLIPTPRINSKEEIGKKPSEKETRKDYTPRKALFDKLLDEEPNNPDMKASAAFDYIKNRYKISSCYYARETTKEGDIVIKKGNREIDRMTKDYFRRCFNKHKKGR